MLALKIGKLEVDKTKNLVIYTKSQGVKRNRKFIAMTLKKAVLITIWFILWLVVWIIFGKLIFSPDSLLNFIGTIIVIIYVIVSIETRCFTRKWNPFKINNKK